MFVPNLEAEQSAEPVGATPPADMLQSAVPAKPGAAPPPGMIAVDQKEDGSLVDAETGQPPPAPPPPAAIPEVQVTSLGPDATPYVTPPVGPNSSRKDAVQAQFDAMGEQRGISRQLAEEAAATQAATDKITSKQISDAEHGDEEMRAFAEKHFKETEARQAAVDKENDDVSKMKVDPSRYFASMTALQKFLMVLGAGMSGYASGLQGRASNFMDQMFQNQKADIDAQVGEIENRRAGIKERQTAMGSFRQKGLDQMGAKAAVIEGQFRIGEVALKTMAAKTTNSQLKAQYLDRAAQLGAQAGALRETRINADQARSAAAAAAQWQRLKDVEKNRIEVALANSTINKETAAANKDNAEAAERTGASGLLLPHFNMGQGGRLTGFSGPKAQEELAKARGAYAPVLSFKETVNELKELVGPNSSAWDKVNAVGTATNRQIAMLSHQLVSQFVDTNHGGVISPAEREAAEKKIGDITSDVFTGNRLAALEAMGQHLHRITDARVRAMGGVDIEPDKSQPLPDNRLGTTNVKPK